jgi:hypothetical protein
MAEPAMARRDRFLKETIVTLGKMLELCKTLSGTLFDRDGGWCCVFVGWIAAVQRYKGMAVPKERKEGCLG